MEINQNKNELHLYPVSDNEWMGAIDVDEGNKFNSIPTVIVLDSSGSMGHATYRLVRKIFPLVMSMLSYDMNHVIHLISFGDDTVYKEVPISALSLHILNSNGGTFIGPAIAKLRSVLDLIGESDPDQPIRVLSISDGEISDPDDAKDEVEKLMSFLADSDLTINSQAVRLFTTNAQPDTKALCWLLQINNTGPTELCDIMGTETNENIAKQIAALFRSDNFDRHRVLQFNEEIVLRFPWYSFLSTRVILVPGWNIFWLTYEPTGYDVMMGCLHIKVVKRDSFNLATFHRLMETKMHYIIDHMVILKVVGTADADTLANEIFSNLNAKEDSLALSYFDNRTIMNLLTKIIGKANDFHGSEEMAKFLRRTSKEMKSEYDGVTQRAHMREDEERREQNKSKEAEDEERRKEAEDEDRRKAAEDEDRRKAAEDEDRRKAAEDEDRRKAAEDEDRRKEAEDEDRRKEADDEKRRKEADDEKRRKEAEDEKRRKEAEDEDRRKAAEDEDRRKEAEDEDRRKEAEDEERRKEADDEKRRKEAEDEDRRKEAEDEKRRKEAEDVERLKEAEDEERLKKDEEVELQLEKTKSEDKLTTTEKNESLKLAEPECRTSLQNHTSIEEERERKLLLQKKLEAGELFEQDNLQPSLERSNELQHINEKQDSAKRSNFVKRQTVKENYELVTEKTPVSDQQQKVKSSLITTAANKVRQFTGAMRRDNDSNSKPIQTIFILDENVSVTKKTCRFTEKIIPLVFSKISYEQSQLVHLLTVLRDKSSVLQMLQSILQTLDASKRIRILVLTHCGIQEHFPEELIEFLSESNYLFELQVVRLASECRQSLVRSKDATTKYQLFDIDAKKSNTLIATRIVELFQSNSYQKFEQEQLRIDKENGEKLYAQLIAAQQLDVQVKQIDDLRALKCEFCGGDVGNYRCGYYVLFLAIFAIPILLLLLDIFISSYKK